MAGLSPGRMPVGLLTVTPTPLVKISLSRRYEDMNKTNTYKKNKVINRCVSPYLESF